MASADPPRSDGSTASASSASSAAPNAARLPPRQTRGLFQSSLTRRILTINLIAPLFLGAGFFYFDIYKRALYEGRFSTLETEAVLISAAVAQTAVVWDVAADTWILDPARARRTMTHMADLADIRVRMFDEQGALLADSRPPRMPVPPSHPGPGASDAGGGAPGPVASPPVTAARTLFDNLIPLRREVRGLPLEPEIADPSATDYAEVLTALNAERTGHALRVTTDQKLMLSTAVPLVHDGTLLGAIMIARDGDDIIQSLFEVRTGVLEAATTTLMLTICLSLYLAGTIARPLVRLASAADRVRTLKSGRAHGIPDYSDRKDELGDLSGALRGMTQALWARMDAIEGFAADVAHELKNPLTSLKSAVETAARMKDPEKQKRLMDVILHDVERLDRLISDISDASRLDAELSRAEGEAVPLAPLLETLIRVHESEAHKHEVTLALDLPPGADGLEVVATEGRLVQVFRNLILNGLSFSPPGGTLRIGVNRLGDRVVITVDDQGPGIPPGAHERIFSRFYSERPSGEKFGQHSGLGLAISRQIVETYGGQIRAANRKDDTGRTVGARFTVDLMAVIRPEEDE